MLFGLKLCGMFGKERGPCGCSVAGSVARSPPLVVGRHSLSYQDCQVSQAVTQLMCGPCSSDNTQYCLSSAK